MKSSNSPYNFFDIDGTETANNKRPFLFLVVFFPTVVIMVVEVQASIIKNPLSIIPRSGMIKIGE